MAPPSTELSDSERKLIESIGNGNVEEVKLLLNEPDVHVDCYDDHGMTPLQHAAYKANTELCEILLTHGADVNANKHEHGYTALMFAAISGNVEVTQIILQAGAKVYHQNSVGRTAAQMAGFVGQHQCVSLINNFVSREDLDYYCKPRGLETEAKLPPRLAPSLYSMILLSNLSPVKLSLYLQEHSDLLDESYKVAKVLDILCEKAMKQSETNEVMGVKFHYMAYLLRAAEKCRQDKADNLDFWIKSLVRGRESDGFAEKQERLLRAMLKEFPYMENQLILQLIRTLAPVTVGGDPTALNVLSQGVNGQRFHSEEDHVCNTCADLKAESKCSACKMVRYCNAKCQKLHWTTHKKFCKELAEEFKEHQIAEEKRKREEEEKKLEEEARKLEEENSKADDNERESHEAEPSIAEPVALDGKDQSEEKSALSDPVGDSGDGVAGLDQAEGETTHLEE